MGAKREALFLRDRSYFLNKKNSMIIKIIRKIF